MAEEHDDQFKFFHKSRIVLYVEHPFGPAHEPDALARLVKESASKWGGSEIETPDPKDIKTFHVRDEIRALSIIPANVPDGEVARIVNTVFRTVGDEPFTLDGADEATRVVLTAASPDWLIPSASHGISHGGPGGLPVRAENADRVQHSLTFPGIPSLQGSQSEAHGGQGVTVIILDTAPSEKLITDARERYENEVPNNHPLFRSLLVPPEKRLKIDRSCRVVLEQTEALYGAGINVYRMSDHGLFVAGIINSIAPEAELHLYEVLNRFGVGLIETVADGLARALEMRNANPDQRLIVNCSLMLGAPEATAMQRGGDDFARLFSTVVFNWMIAPIQAIITLLDGAGVSVVAAAGNDAHDEPASQRPRVRYPAACDGATAVGAVPRGDGGANGWKAATYSNEPNRRAGRHSKRHGYLTLGGEEGPNQGVLGIYLDDWPGTQRTAPASNHAHTFDHEYQYEVPNDTGWAWWAGTSFATPIITGLLALTRPSHGSGTPASTADAAQLDILAQTSTGTGGNDQRVIYAEQG